MASLPLIDGLLLSAKTISCNSVLHLLRVEDYGYNLSDGWFYWTLACLARGRSFRAALWNGEPDLSFCPYCSDRKISDALVFRGDDIYQEPYRSMKVVLGDEVPLLIRNHADESAPILHE